MGKPIVEYEAGQTPYPFDEMTDGGDQITFEAAVFPWSDVAGAAPVIAPYGLLTGGVVSPGALSDDIDVAALTAMMPGAVGADPETGVLSVGAGTVAITRGTVSDPFRINSITVDSTGALAVVPGAEGAAFSEEYGAAGGPPWIPVGSIQIAQVRTASDDVAVVAWGEIYAVPNIHQERSDYPVYMPDFGRGQITFAAPLPNIHTGGVPKKVYVRVSVPLFAPLAFCADWVPAETTYSVSSEDSYDGPIGSESSSLNQASFTALGLKDGITDPVVKQKGNRLWFKFRPDRNRMAPFMLTQGVLGVSRAFPAAGGSFSANCTITPQNESLDVEQG